MRFTKHQYEQAILALQNGIKQLEPEPNGCAICGDSCVAYNCRFNPLNAMAMCKSIAATARVLHQQIHDSEETGANKDDLISALHDFMHLLAGEVTNMGETVGPAGVVIPSAAPE